MEYLAIRLPGVAISHSLIHRRAISELRVTVGSEAYKLRWRRKRLESCPDLGLPLWIERLL
ncbi:MAG: hypothetical protein ACREP9_17950, partial [Candidatus Dormibacteraceae bacterium]